MNPNENNIIDQVNLRECYNKLQMQYYYERKNKGISKQIIPKEQQKKRGRKPTLLNNSPNNTTPPIAEDKMSIDNGINLESV